MSNVRQLRPSQMNDSEAQREFDIHVPYSDATSLVLKSHLLLERALVRFIGTRAPTQIVDQIVKGPEFTFPVKVAMAQAVAHHDFESVYDGEKIWPALLAINTLRNKVAHNLEHVGSSLDDKMCNFIQMVDPDGSLWDNQYRSRVYWFFRQSAEWLYFLLTLSKEPITESEIEFDGDG